MEQILRSFRSDLSRDKSDDLSSDLSESREFMKSHWVSKCDEMDIKEFGRRRNPKIVVQVLDPLLEMVFTCT